MILDKKKIRQNFRQIISQATPQTLQDGKVWYIEAKRWSDIVAHDNNVDREIVIGVLSALSPGVKWELNARQAENLIHGYTALSDVNGVVISTYKRQLKKAIEILDLHETNYVESDILDILGKRAYKTKSFYENIMNPYCDIHVTVDHHIWNAAGLATKTWINKGEYTTISKIIIELSREYDLVPCQLQAIIWLTYKEIEKGLPI